MTRPTLLQSIILFLALAPLGLTGCAGLGNDGGRLAATGEGDAGRVTLEGDFTTATYSLDGRNRATLVLIDGPVEDPEQIVTIRLFWRPRAGKTPIDPNATNAAIQYVIFDGDGGDVGIYTGAGFLFPRNKPNFDRFNGGLWQANLQLSARTVGFKDLLGQAHLSGDVKATFDPIATETHLDRINRLITQRLGEPRLVNAANTLASAGGS